MIPVDTYMNLNNGCISVRSRATANYGKVISHEDAVVIEDATFVVQPAGQQKVRDSGRKNVHAFVRGNWLPDADAEPERTEVMYNPYEYDHFVTVDHEQPVRAADTVAVTTSGVTAQGVCFK